MRGGRWPDGKPFIGFKPGDFTFGSHCDDLRDPPKWFRYGCPRGRGECMVPIFPRAYSYGATWRWDGNRDAPTLTPSINCLAEKDGQKLAGCGWHGWVRAG